MKTTRQYVADAKRRLDISSDYALAKALGITKQSVALLASGRSVMNNTTAAKVAEILELEPLQVIADCELERGSSPELWKRIRAAAAIAGAALLYALMAERSAFDIAWFSAALPMDASVLAFVHGMFNVTTHCAIFGAMVALAALASIAAARLRCAHAPRRCFNAL